MDGRAGTGLTHLDFRHGVQEGHQRCAGVAQLGIVQAAGEPRRQVEYHDPYVKPFGEGAFHYKGVPISRSSLAQYDCVVLSTNHSCFDYAMIAESAKLIVDTRNAFKAFDYPHIIRLGTPGCSPSVQEWCWRNEEREVAAAGRRSTGECRLVRSARGTGGRNCWPVKILAASRHEIRTLARLLAGTSR